MGRLPARPGARGPRRPCARAAPRGPSPGRTAGARGVSRPLLPFSARIAALAIRPRLGPRDRVPGAGGAAGRSVLSGPGRGRPRAAPGAGGADASGRPLAPLSAPPNLSVVRPSGAQSPAVRSLGVRVWGKHKRGWGEGREAAAFPACHVPWGRGVQVSFQPFETSHCSPPCLPLLAAPRGGGSSGSRPASPGGGGAASPAPDGTDRPGGAGGRPPRPGEAGRPHPRRSPPCPGARLDRLRRGPRRPPLPAPRSCSVGWSFC